MARQVSKLLYQTIELLGGYVIPKLDTDPEHRTTAFRCAAAAQ